MSYKSRVEPRFFASVGNNVGRGVLLFFAKTERGRKNFTMKLYNTLTKQIEEFIPHDGKPSACIPADPQSITSRI